MYRLKTLAAAALIALGAAACSEEPTAPGEVFDAELAAVDDYGFTMGSGPGQGCATGPGTCFGAGSGAGMNRSYLGTLAQQAYGQLVTEQGQEAADAAFATLWQLHQDAFALRSTDREAFVAEMEAAHAETVRLVIAVLGPETAETVLALAADRVTAFEALVAERAAAGGDPARLQAALARAAAFLADGQAAYASGDAVTALDLGSRALQIATRAGGQGGRGTGMMGGRQRRRGG